jgi:hypothetical protein
MVFLVDVFTFFVEKAASSQKVSVSSQKVSVSSQKVSVFFPKSFSFYSYIAGNQCIMI